MQCYIMCMFYDGYNIIILHSFLYIIISIYYNVDSILHRNNNTLNYGACESLTDGIDRAIEPEHRVRSFPEQAVRVVRVRRPRLAVLADIRPGPLVGLRSAFLHARRLWRSNSQILRARESRSALPIVTVPM